MILLDTNIVSETFRVRPDRNVTAWLDRQSWQSLFLCAPVLAELHYGVARLQPGKRKDGLVAAVEQIELHGFRGRILPFDAAAAVEYGRLAARLERAGRPGQKMDTLVAAIASANRYALATRNVRDFADLGLEIVNPFDATE